MKGVLPGGITLLSGKYFHTEKMGKVTFSTIQPVLLAFSVLRHGGGYRNSTTRQHWDVSELGELS